MRRNNLRGLSFYEAELGNNYARYKKLSELESKLALNDLTNHHLVSEIQHLKEENSRLREKIYEKEVASTAVRVKNSKKTAIDMVNSLLDGSNPTAMQTLKEKCQQFHNSNYQELSNKVANYFRRPKEATTQHLPQQHQVLNKHVYIDQPLKERQMDQNKLQETVERSEAPKEEHQKMMNRSSIEGNRRELMREDEASKFPANLNEFEGKKAQSRFLQCREVPQDSQNKMNRWNSDYDINLKSEFLGRLNSGEIKKRKTFLSVVSISQKQHKKDNYN